MAEYRSIQAEGGAGKPNFLYYVSKKYLNDEGEEPARRLRDAEATVGLYRIPSRHGSDLEAQVIELNKLRPDWLDPRVYGGLAYEWMANTDALILNVDYPLGLGAYEILIARQRESLTLARCLHHGQGRYAQRAHRRRDDLQCRP